MEREQRDEQSISLSMSRIAEMTTCAITNRGKVVRFSETERTHEHKQPSGTDII